ncbi:carboxylate-amine ligase [Longispora fulva]|uniref:Putative glutamate--cysteine ligase 2 n=1 Tax=Longispora fulva TaxID=619741 RepID=A0A8J7KGP3_9ACTN|nr:glutamate--cysteine ligase [Longispora fulva]MBG6135139.1 carboxylate-amine ligase [Longispora fulva]
MGAADESSRAGSGPRFGVEEEFLVVDPASRVVVPHAEGVIRRARERLGARVSGEITKMQLETKTDPCGSAKELFAQLTEARGVLGACAAAEGVRVVATGTSVLAGTVPPPITEGARQDRGIAKFRGLHDEQAICAVHVHVEMPDRDRALRVSNHLRPFLPVLITLTANSPFWDGRDSGYASWRTTVWPRWPVAGPPPFFTSVAHYDGLIDTFLSVGALVDTGTIFWDIRPSVSHPTIEIRVADVPITAEESALYAALVRALVVHVGAAVDRGEDGPEVSPELLRVAYWQASRDGLAGDGLDVRTGLLVPAAEQVRNLFDLVRPVLEDNGDLDLVSGWLRRLFDGGTGATRQRAAAERAGDPAGAVDHLVAHTAPSD